MDMVDQEDTEALICLGDLSLASTLVHLARRYAQEIHLVAGNTDDTAEIKATIDRERLLTVYFHQLHGRLTFDHKRVAFTHKPHDATSLRHQGFDLILYGHTHQADVADTDGEIVANPGDIQGRYGQSPSYAIYDTKKGSVTLHTVSENP